MSGLGLISVLPPQTLVAMALHAAGFIAALNQKKIPTPLVLLQLMTWVLMLHGFNALVAPEPVFGVAWRHAGITDYIIQNGALDPSIDAYFSWPGFFGLSALATRIAALASPVQLIAWSPPFFNFLYLAPLALIYKSASSDKRTVWLALWLFYTTNWIGQDYFSPQAFAYFAYLLVLGILLKWFVSDQRIPQGRLRRRIGPGRRTFGRPPATDLIDLGDSLTNQTRAQRFLAAAVLIVVFAATVASHQLTPFALLVSAALLATPRLITLRSLPVLMAVMVGVWISYMAVTFLAGHAEMVFKPLGLKESAAVNVQGRLQGSSEHVVVVYTRLAMAAIVWLLAAVGALRGRRHLHRYLACLALTVAPFPLLVLQPYGGEMLLRVYLLSLPFCALFLAALLTTPRSGATLGAPRVLVAILVIAVLTGGFLVSRYGNQTIDVFTPQEVEGVSQLYRLAPKGSLLLAGDGNLPWKYRDYGGYEYKTLDEYRLDFGSKDRLAGSVASIMDARSGSQAFLIVTRSQRETVKLLGVRPPSKGPVDIADGDQWLTHLETALQSSPEFDVLFQNRDSTIFTLRG
jgi:hypothetical protein